MERGGRERRNNNAREEVDYVVNGVYIPLMKSNTQTHL